MSVPVAPSTVVIWGCARRSRFEGVPHRSHIYTYSNSPPSAHVMRAQPYLTTYVCQTDSHEVMKENTHR